MASQKPQKTRFIRPPNLLRKKVGYGGINEMLLERAQNQIEMADYGFEDFAKDFLKKFSESFETAEKQNSIDPIIPPVMQLKANGGMFQYQLMSDVADIALQFLESIEGFNEDAHAVLKAHEKTLQIILENKLKGDGGDMGYELVKELDRACKRYFSKHPLKK